MILGLILGLREMTGIFSEILPRLQTSLKACFGESRNTANILQGLLPKKSKSQIFQARESKRRDKNDELIVHVIVAAALVQPSPVESDPYLLVSMDSYKYNHFPFPIVITFIYLKDNRKKKRFK